jgi:hypothetical protein
MASRPRSLTCTRKRLPLGDPCIDFDPPCPPCFLGVHRGML